MYATSSTFPSRLCTIVLAAIVSMLVAGAFYFGVQTTAYADSISSIAKSADLGRTYSGNLTDTQYRAAWKIDLDKGTILDITCDTSLWSASSEIEVWNAGGDVVKSYDLNWYRNRVTNRVELNEQISLSPGVYYVVLKRGVSSNDVDDYTISFSASFNDVTSGDWFYDVVRTAANNGYINGYGNGYFGPNDTITRAQAATIIWNMSGESWTRTTTDFYDVPGSEWYAKAVSFCSAKGIVGGYGNGYFGPNDYVTREQFSTMIANYAKYRGVYSSVSQSILNSYTDSWAISDWARPDVAWAVSKGVIGLNSNVVLPADSIKRSEAAAMAVRFQPNPR